MSLNLANLQNEVKSAAEQVANVFVRHTGGRLYRSYRSRFSSKRPVLSDMDFTLFLKESVFEGDRMLPLELYISIHRDLAKIHPSPFRYIQLKRHLRKFGPDLLTQFPAPTVLSRGHYL